MTDDFSFFTNISVWCAFLAWLLAQVLKFIFSAMKHKQIDFRILTSLGGMPSSHSCMAAALAASVGLAHGLSSTMFAVALVFAAVVMFDAQSVRRASGHQARLLNQMVQELFKGHHLGKQRLVELLGHTPLEVILGMLLGIVIAINVHLHWPL